MEKTFKVFLSCSFSKEDEILRNFFKKTLESFGFQLIIYDFQELGTIPDGIKEKIQTCQCLIAIVTKRFKIEGSAQYISPSWLSTEIGWADAFKKPLAVFVEEGVSLAGFPKIERHQKFDRANLLNDVPKITKYLLNIRDLLVDSESATSIPSPILMRNYVHTVFEIISPSDCFAASQVSMTSLSNELTTCHHSNTSESVFSPSVKPRKFEFFVIDKPKNVQITNTIEVNDSKQFLWRINFKPPLIHGESVTYCYKHENRNSCPFTLEEATKRAGASVSFSGKPVAYESWIIRYPTQDLRMELLFPKNYNVRSPGVWVEIGRSGNAVESETQRLKKENCLKIETFLGKTKLILNIHKPCLGYKYLVFWTPPRKSELPLKI